LFVCEFDLNLIHMKTPWLIGEWTMTTEESSPVNENSILFASSGFDTRLLDPPLIMLHNSVVQRKDGTKKAHWRLSVYQYHR
ncbi:MAG: hypothetical protein OXT74_00280, partial [Candidatus Poribacteria bacterium]|nr:hypothetical protein [Candidatus Poribacteria bacterium]